MKRALIYARVSSQEQAAEDKLSTEVQLADCDHYCRERGWIVADRFIDVQSGRDATKDREHFERMLQACYRQQGDVIVVWRPDRAYRGLMPAAKLKKTLDETGVDIVGVKQPLDKNLLGLWAWVAEQEIEGMGQRFRAASRANAKGGKWQGGFVKYGYRYNDDRRSPNYTGKLEMDQQEAEVVRGLFEWIDQGKTAASWCRWANSREIPTKRNSRGWTAQTVSEKLRDSSYTGKGYYGKLTRRGNKLVSAEDPVPMDYPQIVDNKLFQRVQRKLAENTKTSHGAAKTLYLLQHLGRCGECGGSLSCTTNSYGYRHLYCLNQRRFPHMYHCYKPQRWPLGDVEDYVWGEVEYVLGNYRAKIANRLADESASVEATVEGTISKAKKEIERCQLERQRLLTAVRKGWASGNDANLQFQAIKADEEQWKLELTRADSVRANIDVVQDAIWKQVGKVYATCDWWWHTAFQFSRQDKKTILNAVLDKFVLHRDGRIELRLKVPASEDQLVSTIAIASRNDVSLP